MTDTDREVSKRMVTYYEDSLRLLDAITSMAAETGVSLERVIAARRKSFEIQKKTEDDLQQGQHPAVDHGFGDITAALDKISIYSEVK